jgi:CRISPR/Cas system-associated exonuclease Cas4 (RecB family)
MEQKKAYEGLIYRQVAEKMPAAKPDEREFFIAGFGYLSKSEEKIINTLRTKSRVQIIWDTDDYYVDDECQESGSFFRKYKYDWRIDNSLWQNDLIGKAPKSIRIIGVAKNVGQTKVAADIIGSKLNLKDGAEKETVVVMPDETLLNPLLAAMPAAVSALNISMGFPLRDSLIARLLKSIFAMHENIERFGSKKPGKIRFYYKDVFDIIHHPYTAYLIPDKEAISDFVERVREHNRNVITEKELGEYFKYTQFAALFWYSDNSSVFLERILGLIDSFRLQFLSLTRADEKDLSIDVELLFRVHGIIKNLQNIISKNSSALDVQSLRKLINEMLRSQRVPFEGEPVQGLQIMGTLETQCLDFKNVIILSMNEGIFPSGKVQNSYIPFEMKREFLSTYREKDANSAYLFYRLLQRAENIFLIYNTESDELGGGEKSRFILQLQHELTSRNSQAKIEDLIYSVDAPASLPEDDITIAKTPSLMTKLIENITGYGISPSAINSYINCSLQYYLRYVARLREQDDLEESIEASTLGSAVHEVLEELYKTVLNEYLTIPFIEERIKDKEQIAVLLRKALDERFDEESLKSGKNYLIYRVCLKLVDEFLKQEKINLKLLADAGARIKLLMLEKEMEHILSVRGYDVRIKGKVDRVEECNGIVSVADYKTGTPAGSSIKSDDAALFSTDPKYAKAMQLLTYAWLFWRSNGANEIQLRTGIYWLREISKGFDPLKIDGSDIVNAATLLQFEVILKNVLDDLLNPEIPLAKTPDFERCVNCEFRMICRR